MKRINLPSNKCSTIMPRTRTLVTATVLVGIGAFAGVVAAASFTSPSSSSSSTSLGIILIRSRPVVAGRHSASLATRFSSAVAVAAAPTAAVAVPIRLDHGATIRAQTATRKNLHFIPFSRNGHDGTLNQNPQNDGVVAVSAAHQQPALPIILFGGGGGNKNGTSWNKSDHGTTTTVPVSLMSIMINPISHISVVTWICIVAHILAGLAGVPIVSKARQRWYDRIVLPTWIPPKRLFGPVWTSLYASMGYVLATLIQVTTATVAQANLKRITLMVYAVHLFVNLSWAWVFFGMKRFRAALFMNYALLVSLVGAIIPLLMQLPQPVSSSCWTLFPYVVWLSFATALNQTICRLNPTDAFGYNNAKFQDDLYQLQQDAATYAGGVEWK